MKVQIKRLFLLDLLEKASTVTTASTTSPFLQSFLLEIGEGGTTKRTDKRLFHVLRTDTVLSAVAHTDKFELLEDTEPYRTLVNAPYFLDLVRNLESEEIILTIPDEFSIQIEADSFKANWTCFDVKKFPKVPKCIDTKDMHKMKTETFVRGVERVKYAVAKDSVQSNLKQIFFSKKECWASDGFVYQRVDCPTDVEFSLSNDAFDVTKFAKLSGVEDMYFKITDDSIFFIFGQDIFMCQKSNVKPPFMALFSKMAAKNQGRFIVEVEQLRKIIKRIGITTVENKVTFNVKQKSLTVSGEDISANKSQEVLPIEFAGSQKALRKFNVNWEFLDKALSVVRSKTIELHIDLTMLQITGEDCVGIIPMFKDRV